MTTKSPAGGKPTNAELDILQTLWRTGPATVKQVHAAMAAGRDSLTYANVLRLMQIMHGKGLLTRDEAERSHVYAAAQSQKATQGGHPDRQPHAAGAGPARPGARRHRVTGAGGA
ncbi:BlaI/MecI/CopY family transcriptional regulator, partial [Achromobacter xylosoxidans]|uniref:BlaI/MecI/CopY family transcriptional regulator n=1 Tax=Alcaligenes xylosoxydans xylosoxydans TaxID=85698 RepID=UPI0008A5C59A